MTKLSLVPHDDKAEALYWLDKVKRMLSPDPVERHAALMPTRTSAALTAIPSVTEDEPRLG
jgi:hypothetical protein